MEISEELEQKLVLEVPYELWDANSPSSLVTVSPGTYELFRVTVPARTEPWLCIKTEHCGIQYLGMVESIFMARISQYDGEKNPPLYIEDRKISGRTKGHLKRNSASKKTSTILPPRKKLAG